MDAFSMLAAPLAVAAQQGPHNPAPLIAFFAQEMQLFFAHIQASVATYNETGELPHSVFSAKLVKSVQAQGKRKAKGEKGPKTKRKPSAFNLFIQEKMAELKAAGVQPAGGTELEEKRNNPLLTMAAKEWSKLSDDEKKAYAAKVAPRLAAMAGGAAEVADGAATAAAAAGDGAEHGEASGAGGEEESSEEESEEEESEEEEEEESSSSSSSEEEEPAPAPPPKPESPKKKKKKIKHAQ